MKYEAGTMTEKELVRMIALLEAKLDNGVISANDAWRLSQLRFELDEIQRVRSGR